MQGLLNVDKPLGITSHDVVGQVRRLASMRRVGHAGTLDPLATGVLVLALGQGTRLLEYVTGQRKQYQAQVRLGQTTTTYDAEGAVVEEQPVLVTAADVEAALVHFQGTIEQIPPIYSAIKKDGKPLYEMARKGIEVEVEPRTVTIYHLELTEWEPPFLGLNVVCSTGTYIRSLAHDLGQVLGCGAFLSGLRRLAVGSFDVSGAVPLDSLTSENIERHLQPIDRAVAHLPRLDLTDEGATQLSQGQWLPRIDREPAADLVRAYDPQGHFVGVIAATNGQWRPRKILYHPTE